MYLLCMCLTFSKIVEFNIECLRKENKHGKKIKRGTQWTIFTLTGNCQILLPSIFNSKRFVQSANESGNDSKWLYLQRIKCINKAISK